MKKNAKKGFTTVELVIVIAVIAILAAALAVSLVVINNKNDEVAKMQRQNEHIIEDLRDAIENKNENYLTAADFQEKLEEALEAALSKINNVSIADVEAAVNAAILAFQQNNPTNSGLTESQVKDIVADALENIDSGLSENEIKDIVKDILNGK